MDEDQRRDGRLYGLVAGALREAHEHGGSFLDWLKAADLLELGYDRDSARRRLNEDEFWTVGPAAWREMHADERLAAVTGLAQTEIDEIRTDALG